MSSCRSFGRVISRKLFLMLSLAMTLISLFTMVYALGGNSLVRASKPRGNKIKLTLSDPNIIGEFEVLASDGKTVLATGKPGKTSTDFWVAVRSTGDYPLTVKIVDKQEDATMDFWRVKFDGHTEGPYRDPACTNPYPGSQEYDPLAYVPTGGGILIQVDKFGLLAPYVGLASIILVATVATIIHTKRRDNKQ